MMLQLIGDIYLVFQVYARIKKIFLQSPQQTHAAVKCDDCNCDYYGSLGCRLHVTLLWQIENLSLLHIFILAMIAKKALLA